ncbi:molybdate ABC transporter substrate-binding protein [Arthrobacter sulfonylureivorans]|uniref:Molybdate ABC transporter substrate-binding protein n=1 Tax=Arthrobacter sulfonylureivorans TaxID=2486855 RepID=A0ABY3WDZ4_9MICC|nr:molybdate ABC transporter substrate-binding protein [Arthrobacter sulfonylureivorans]UNK47647.1 molybdate ABC transporter substrate-binding protein [Arthrobacter sulfonylureivorans]
MLAVLLGGALLATTACTAAGQGPQEAPASGSASSGELNVFAAASLNGVLTDLTADFEDDHPDVTVRLNFAGSSDLATQILSGAPADVFASANPENMDKVTAPGMAAGEPVTFATNVLQIVVPEGNPYGIASLADLADQQVKTVICAPQVPCGAATQKVSQEAGIKIPAVSEESSVTDVLGKVMSGEADAGLVYVTDVKNVQGDVEGIDFAEAGAAVNDYPIARLAESANPDAAEAFVALVTGPEGRKALADYGFGTP